MELASRSAAWIGTAAFAVPAAIAVLKGHLQRRRRQRLTVPPPPPQPAEENDDKPPPPAFDVIIVGAGPAGSTLAYFLAHHQKQQAKDKEPRDKEAVATKEEHTQPPLKVLLLERKKFPRVKYCGDAWCAPALDILEQMEWRPGVSVLEELERQGVCRPVQRGGFVSPYGHACINNQDGDATYGSASAVRTYAMKRVLVDEYLARAAQRAPGVQLWEEANVPVKQVSFDGSQWTVPIEQQQHGGDGTTTTVVTTGKVLVAADGATSYLARHLGLVTTDPDATCSHRYVQGGTHQFDCDGVMIFNRSILPGYSALFRHANDDMYLGTYILPGGRATSRCLAPFEDELVQRHPVVQQAFGNKSCAETQWRVQPEQGENGRLKTAPIRCGGEPRSYGDHVLVVGDAAGQTDNMTGEGIHTAMMAATLAAETIAEMFQQRHFGVTATRVYHEKWMDAFGRDFAWSAAGVWVLCHFPIVLDAACAYGQVRGQAFLDDFGQIMTGVQSKAAFLQPHLAVPIAWHVIKQVFWQYVWRRPPLVPSNVGTALIQQQAAAAASKKPRIAKV